VTPELLPVDSDEHDDPSTDRSIRGPQFVQPLSCRYDGGTIVKGDSGSLTELTTIVSGSAPGSLWCSAASSAAEAITVVPCWYAYSIAWRAKYEPP
jgi:hypothetical protein